MNEIRSAVSVLLGNWRRIGSYSIKILKRLIICYFIQNAKKWRSLFSQVSPEYIPQVSEQKFFQNSTKKKEKKMKKEKKRKKFISSQKQTMIGPGSTLDHAWKFPSNFEILF